MAVAAATYNAMLLQLNPNATPDTPLSVQELYDAYCAVTGRSMELEVLLAEMAASYSIGQIQTVWGHQKQDGSAYDPLIDSTLYGVGRVAKVPPFRGALQDFDTNMRTSEARARAEAYARIVEFHRSNLIAAHHIASLNPNHGLRFADLPGAAPLNYVPAQSYNSEHISSFVAPRLFLGHPRTATNLYITNGGFTFVVKYRSIGEADLAAVVASKGRYVSFPSGPYLITGGSDQLVDDLWQSTSYQHVVITSKVICGTLPIDPYIVVVWPYGGTAPTPPALVNTVRPIQRDANPRQHYTINNINTVPPITWNIMRFGLPLSRFLNAPNVPPNNLTTVRPANYGMIVQALPLPLQPNAGGAPYNNINPPAYMRVADLKQPAQPTVNAGAPPVQAAPAAINSIVNSAAPSNIHPNSAASNNVTGSANANQPGSANSTTTTSAVQPTPTAPPPTTATSSNADVAALAQSLALKSNVNTTASKKSNFTCTASNDTAGSDNTDPPTSSNPNATGSATQDSTAVLNTSVAVAANANISTSANDDTETGEPPEGYEENDGDEERPAKKRKLGGGAADVKIERED